MNQGCLFLPLCCPLGKTDDLVVFVTTGSNNKLPEELNEQQSYKVMYHVHLNMSVLYVRESISARGTTDTSETSLTHVVWHAYCTARAFMCLKGICKDEVSYLSSFIIECSKFLNFRTVTAPPHEGPFELEQHPEGDKGWNKPLWRRFWVNFKQLQLASSIDFTHPEREQTTDKAASVQFKAMRSKFYLVQKTQYKGWFFLFVCFFVHSHLSHQIWKSNNTSQLRCQSTQKEFFSLKHTSMDFTCLQEHNKTSSEFTA